MTDYRRLLIDFWAEIEKNNAKLERYAPVPEGWRKESHINYLGDYSPWHLLNLYYPKDYDAAGGKLKSVIYIHGGGWMYGTADLSENYLGWIAAQGYAVMAMNYTLLQYTDLQGIVKDIFDSLHWLENYGEKRGFDLGNVMITGDSAGGHLTGLVSSILEDPELMKTYGVSPVKMDVKAICLNCPCSETDSLYIMEGDGTENGRGTARAYLAMMLGDKGEAAPWSGKTSLSSVMKGIKLPPMLLIGSESESLHQQSRLLMEALDATGQDYETLIWKKEDGAHIEHVFNISHWEWYESLISNKRMLEFFEANC
ncbi:MAG: alpha/beta hydrolase [Lachnospiraceae bacterium]|nr:alpha/beta hydrolase [Lachnospiraceae bacterium]